jgi:hypothetical protein
MRKQMHPAPALDSGDKVDLHSAYFIGVSQNNPVDLGAFLQSNLADSATKVGSFSINSSAVAHANHF